MGDEGCRVEWRDRKSVAEKAQAGARIGGSPSTTTETEAVLPPYRTLSSLGHGQLPRTPWKVTFSAVPPLLFPAGYRFVRIFPVE